MDLVGSFISNPNQTIKKPINTIFIELNKETNAGQLTVYHMDDPLITPNLLQGENKDRSHKRYVC